MSRRALRRLARASGFFCIFLLQGSISGTGSGTATADLAPGGPDPALECPDCDDGSICTIDSCDAEFGTCRHEPLVCDDGNQCTDDFCSPSSGCATNARYVP